MMKRKKSKKLVSGDERDEVNLFWAFLCSQWGRVAFLGFVKARPLFYKLLFFKEKNHGNILLKIQI